MGARISSHRPAAGTSDGNSAVPRHITHRHSIQGVPIKPEQFSYGRMNYLSPDISVPAAQILDMYIAKYESWFPGDDDWNVGLEEQIKLAFKSAVRAAADDEKVDKKAKGKESTKDGETKDEETKVPEATGVDNQRELSKEVDNNSSKTNSNTDSNGNGNGNGNYNNNNSTESNNNIKSNNIKHNNSNSSNKNTDNNNLNNNSNNNVDSSSKITENQTKTTTTYNCILRELESVGYTIQLRTSIIPVDFVLQRRLSTDESNPSQLTNTSAAARAAAESKSVVLANDSVVGISRSKIAPAPQARRGSTGQTRQEQARAARKKRRFSATGVPRLDDAFAMLTISEQEEMHCRNRIKRMVEVFDAVIEDFKAQQHGELELMTLSKSFIALQNRSKRNKRKGTFRVTTEDAYTQAALAAALG